MALSPMVILALKAEIQTLEADRNRITAQLEAIRRLVQEEPHPSGVVPSPSRDETNASLRHGSVKATVFGVLQQHPGWKAAQVTQYLRDAGYQTGGTTRLSHRVYNEIWRMVKDGELVRTNDGGFIASEAAPSG